MINELSGLTVDGLNRALATRQINIRYDFRVTDELGAVFSLSNGAVMNRSRSFDLDAGTWKLSLTILKARIPSGLTLSQYQQIAIDRGIAGGLWAYFRGVIQSIRQSTTRRGGSIVEVLELECEGNLSKLRGNYITRLSMNLYASLRIHPMIGIARTIQYLHPASPALGGGGVTASTIWSVAGDSQMYLRELGGATPGHDANIGTALQVAQNADFSTLYVAGGGSADYHAVTNVYPYQIHWKNLITATNFYVRYRVVDRWIVPKVRPTNKASGLATQTISLPAGYYVVMITGVGSANVTVSGGPSGTYYSFEPFAFNLTATTSITFTMSGTISTFEVMDARGREPYFLCNRRDWQNLLPTTIGSVNVGSRLITPTDAASYITGVSDLSGTEPGLPASGWSNKEYLTVTFSDGAERTVEITAINRTTGQMTVDVFPTHPTLGTNAAAGDRIRVSTLEAVQAFDGRYPAALGELLTGATAPQAIDPVCAGVYYPIAQVLPFTGHTRGGTADLYWLSTSYLMGNRDAQDYTVWNAAKNGIYTIEDAQITDSGNVITNRVEDQIRLLTSTRYSIGPYGYSTDWVIDNTGIYSKPRTNAAMYLDEVVKEIMGSSFPPNVLIRDRVDGKIRLGPVAQAAVPAYVLPGVASVELQDNAERISSMTVISVNDQDDPSDIASMTFGGVSVEGTTPTWSNPQYVFDGRDDTKATWVDVAGDVESFLNTMWFTIPPGNPLEIYPTIDSIRIAGQGLIIAVYYRTTTTPVQSLTQADLFLNWTLLSSVDWIPLQANQPFVIDGKDLERLIAAGYYTSIAISVRQVTDTTAGVAGISSVEILQRKVNAHTARMTDNPNIAPASPVNAAGFGTTWTQPDGNLNMSFRYAPTAWIKRNSVQYGNRVDKIVMTARGTGYTSIPTISVTDGTGTDNGCIAEVKNGRVTRVFESDFSNRGFVSIPTVTFSSGAATAQADIARPRKKIIRLGNMPQAECRTYAENYMDEYLRSHLVYTVQAPLLDYAEPGDTVLVQLPDGSQKALLLWGITDSGGPGDNMATYTLRDYSL